MKMKKKILSKKLTMYIFFLKYKKYHIIVRIFHKYQKVSIILIKEKV